MIKKYRAYKSLRRYPLLDEELKKCRTLKDLDNFLIKIGKIKKKQLCLRGKLRGYWAFEFTKRNEGYSYENYVQYLYDDGVTDGISEVKNLHRVLMVTDR